VNSENPVAPKAVVRRSLRAFLIASLFTFILSFGTLLWLGPVWIYDLQENWFAFIVSAVILLVFLSCLGGEAAAGILGAAVEVSAATATVGATLVGRFIRGVGPSSVGVLFGVAISLFTAWLVAQAKPVRLGYAKSRPERALAHDYIAVAKLLQDLQRTHGRVPSNMTQLVTAIESNQIELKYSYIKGGIWFDPWDRPFQYRTRKNLIGLQIDVYSHGADGVDNQGRPDDISMQSVLSRWKALERQLRSLIDKLMEKR
jgi:hypothetical protein